MAETNNLGEYKIGKTIGRGAFSKIKLATHLLSEEKVAIKCITKESIAQMRKEQIESSERAKDKRASQQKIINELGGIPDPTITSSNSLATSPALSSTFIDEVKLLMRLDHPNIVKIYQLMDSPKWINIVLEYAPAGSLSQFILAQGGRLNERAARTFFQQIVSAVDHCHAAGVAHRDLKMENMLLNAQNQILLTDFGLGRSLLASNISETFCGTPSHAAIEVINGIPYNAEMADTWSLGIILYIMIAGKNPFAAGTIHQLYKRVRALDYSFPDEFSMDLRDLISRILVKVPVTRITIRNICLHNWTTASGVYPFVPVPPLPLVDVAKSVFSVSSEEGEMTVYKFRKHHIDFERRVKDSALFTASDPICKSLKMLSIKSSASSSEHAPETPIKRFTSIQKPKEKSLNIFRRFTAGPEVKEALENHYRAENINKKVLLTQETQQSPSGSSYILDIDT